MQLARVQILMLLRDGWTVLSRWPTGLVLDVHFQVGRLKEVLLTPVGTKKYRFTPVHFLWEARVFGLVGLVIGHSPYS